MRLSHRIYRMLGAGVSVYSFFFIFFFIVTRLRLNETGYEMLVDLRSNGPVRPLNAWQGTNA